MLVEFRVKRVVEPVEPPEERDHGTISTICGVAEMLLQARENLVRRGVRHDARGAGEVEGARSPSLNSGLVS
jgi:hypothetical protein